MGIQVWTAVRAVVALLCVGILAGTAGQASADVSLREKMLEIMVGNDQFNAIRISPTGEYFAATVPLEKTTSLVIIRRADMRVTGGLYLRDLEHVIDFAWVSDDRILANVGRRRGRLEAPVPTGELIGVNVDDSRKGVIAGARAAGGGHRLGSRVGGTQAEAISAFLIDPLRDDPRHALVSVWQWVAGAEQFPTAERIDVNTGRRTTVVRAPVRRAEFHTDLAGDVRFAVGSDENNRVQTHYRAASGGDWTLLNNQASSERIMTPIGFSEDNATAYVTLSQSQGPDAIYALDTATLELTRVLRGEFADPIPIHDPRTRALIGAMFMEGRPRMAFLDEASSGARLFRSLEASFEGLVPVIHSATRDGSQAMVNVGSDRNPVDYYVFDAKRMAVDFVVGRREGIDPRQMGERRPVSLTARDGLELHGYLTVPQGRDARGLPLVVNPHGGPFGPYDDWFFDPQAQLLAAAGYAVLQVNFRGSGNYGASFTRAGYQQWGGAMQDDLTDATRWAIEQGIADPGRICIYGASYGGYAALMGAAKEPDLYRCAIGSVGVYDMRMMFTQGDIPELRRGRNFLDEVLGRVDLEAISPNRLADRITIPVLLTAGGEDERAPPDHTRRMESALRASGSPVEAVIYRNEGHGYAAPDNRRDYFQRVLAFLDTHIGQATAGEPVASD